MSRDSVRLDQWFADQFQQCQNASLRQHRAAFELATFYELVFEDGSGTQAETVQSAKNGYSLSLKDLRIQLSSILKQNPVSLCKPDWTVHRLKFNPSRRLNKTMLG